MKAQQLPRTGGLKLSPGRAAQNQIDGILNRLDALERRLAALEDSCPSRIPDDCPVQTVGTPWYRVPDDSSEL